MNFGVNLLLFSDVIDRKVQRRFGRIREIGFDGVEVPIFDPGSVDVDGIRRAAERCGLAITTSGALPPGTRLYGKSVRARKSAARYVRDAIRVVAELGAPLICGPLYKAVGDFDESESPATQRWQTARAMAPLAKVAEAAGVMLAFEPLNRFETNFMNTVAQGVEFCRRVESPAGGLLLDTFHMHIEEKDTPAAIRSARRAGVLAHFHASENDRGTAGSGQVNWSGATEALARARYDGWVVLETFSQSNQTIRKAVSCWRPFYDSVEEFLTRGLRFARKRFAPR